MVRQLLPILTFVAVAVSGLSVLRAQEPAAVPLDPAAIAVQEQARLTDARAQSVRASQRSTQLDREAENATDAADAARKRVAALALRIQAAEADIAAAQTVLTSVQRQVRAQQARLDAAREPLLALTAQLQQVSRQPLLAVFVQPGSLRDVVHSRILLDNALPIINARTAGVRAELTRLVRLQARARRGGPAQQRAAATGCAAQPDG